MIVWSCDSEIILQIVTQRPRVALVIISVPVTESDRSPLVIVEKGVKFNPYYQNDIFISSLLLCAKNHF